MSVSCTKEAQQCLNDSEGTESASARLFQCARCSGLTMICRCCDRGNRYCSNCSTPARKEARQRAAKRYQQSPQGRSNHAERQCRYREKQRALSVKMTHQGSSESIDVVTIETSSKTAHLYRKYPDQYRQYTIICDYCEGICSQFLRRDFLSLANRARQR